jgi:carbonic anhydrase
MPLSRSELLQFAAFKDVRVARKRNVNMRIRLLAAALLVAALASAQRYDYTAGDEPWPSAFPLCVDRPVSATGYATSPVSIPTPGAAGVTFTAATYTAEVLSAVPAGQSVVVAYATFVARGNRVTIDTTFLSAWMNFNGSALKLRAAALRRPAEHRLPGMTAADAARSVEQQLFWGTNNVTVLATSRIFVDGGDAGLMSRVQHVTPTFAQSTLVQRAAEAIRANQLFLDLESRESDLGLSSSTTYFNYRGTLTQPPCSSVSWLVDTNAYVVSSDVISAIPLGTARPLKNATAADLLPVAQLVTLAVTPEPTAEYKPVIHADAPSVSEYMRLDFAGETDDLVRLTQDIALQAALYACIALCVLLGLALVLLIVARAVYRPQERSVWVETRKDAKTVRYFGFAPSPLYEQELAPSDDEDDEDDEEDGGELIHRPPEQPEEDDNDEDDSSDDE